jgi:hypothetical protein
MQTRPPWLDYQAPQGVTVPLGPPDPSKAVDLALKKAQLAKAEKDAQKEQVGDAQVEALAKLYAANKLVPPTRPNEVAQKAIARAMELDPEYDPELAANRAKAIKDFSGNGQASQVVRSVNRLAAHLNDMYDASEKMGGPNLGVAPLNRLIAGVEQMGEPRLTAQYDAALPGVANEIDKILRGTGSPTVSGVAESMATLKRARSLDERRAAFKQIAGLIHGALDPIKQSWNSAYGGTRAPPMWVSPAAAAVFGKIDPENADTFGGEDWRGLPGLKGAGDQPTPGPGGPPAGGGMNGGGGPGLVGPDLTPATGGTKTEITHGPLDAKIASMLASGTPSANIRAFAKANGYTKNLEGVLAFRALHPNYRGGYDVHQEKIVPTTIVNRLAASPGGALAASAADTALAGTGDEVVGAVNTLRNGGSLSQNIADADFRKQLLASSNPGSSLAGNVLGGAGAMFGGGAALKALGLGKSAWLAANPVKAALLGDTAFGTAYGAGENNDNRLLGAGVGAVTSPIASLIGQGGAKALGGALRGVVNPAVDRLRAAGIPLTAGEVLGGGWKKAQDAMTSVFGPGNMVARRYGEGREALNQAAFNAAGEPIGAPINAVGQQGIQALDAAKSQAYSNALDPVSLNLNRPDFLNPISGVMSGAEAIPPGELPQGYAANTIKNYIGNNLDPGGVMTGRGFQQAYRGMARTANKASGKIEGHEVGQALGQAKDILASALETQNPNAYEGFLNANSTNRHLNILANAVNAAKNQVDDKGNILFTPAQLGTAATANAKTYGSNIGAAAGNRPFNQLATDAQQVMSSKLPESGTAPRLAMLAGLTALGGGTGYGTSGGEGAVEGAAIPAAALTMLGTRRGQQLLTAALLNRVAPFRVAGAAVRRNPQVGGDILTAAGIPLLDR